MKKMFVSLIVLSCMLFSLSVSAGAVNLEPYMKAQPTETEGITEAHPSETPFNPVHYLKENDVVIPADKGELAHLYASEGWWAPWYIGFIIDNERGLCQVYYDDLHQYLAIEDAEGETEYYWPGEYAEFRVGDSNLQIYMMHHEVWCYASLDTAETIINLYRP